jgi:hypothetical protein
VSELRREARDAERYEEQTADTETARGTDEHTPEADARDAQAHKAKSSYEQ